MSNQEVYNALREECKPYALIRMRRQYFNEMMRRIKLNRCKPATITKFFNTFGYSGKWDSWEKTNKQ